MSYEKDETLFRSHNHGRVQIWSYDLNSILNIVNNYIIKTQETHEIPVENVLYKMILKEYKKILTPNQIAYLEMSDEERKKKYTKQARYDYRKNIQKALMTYFFGEPIKYTRRLNYYLEGIKTGLKILKYRENPTIFSKIIFKNINTNYLNNLIYVVLPSDIRKEIVDCYLNKKVLSDFCINTIAEYVEDDIKEYEEKIKNSPKYHYK
jgi:hypothetical protein